MSKIAPNIIRNFKNISKEEREQWVKEERIKLEKQK